MGRPLLLVVLMLATSGLAFAQSPHQTFFYEHDGLRLQAHLHLPPGTGPFPLVVYNHGSAAPGEERKPWAAPFIARIFVPAGYAVLVPERRGYGESDGQTFAEDIGSDRGPRYIARMEAEAADAHAALTHVLTTKRAVLDPRRVVSLGFSFGGIISTLSVSGRREYAAAIVQAPGALNWQRSHPLRTALSTAAGRITAPLLCLVADNDATTDSARAVCETAKQRGTDARLTIYPAFTGGQPRPGVAAGHALFGPSGVDVWKDDVLRFLAGVWARRVPKA